MKECNCFPTEKGFELLPTNTIRPIKMWNEKIQEWEINDCVEYEDKCPVCKIDILVRAVTGTTYLACCSKECTDKYIKEHPSRYD